MKPFNKTIHSIEFSKSRIDIVISFQYDSEEIDNLTIQHDHWDNGKHIKTTIATDLYTSEMQQSMIDSLDLVGERITEIESRFDDMFENPIEQINNFL